VERGGYGEVVEGAGGAGSAAALAQNLDPTAKKMGPISSFANRTIFWFMLLHAKYLAETFEHRKHSRILGTDPNMKQER
jgi:hypothetical protein